MRPTRLPESRTQLVPEALRVGGNRNDFARDPDGLDFAAQLSQKGRRIGDAFEACGDDGELRFSRRQRNII